MEQQMTLYNRPKPSFVKSPFNYTGGKYPLLKQILFYFPYDIHTLIDVFGGGFNIGINTPSKRVRYNDTITPLVELMEYLYNNRISTTLNYLERSIIENNLNTTDKDSFNKFRKNYNEGERHPLDLYLLICYSFNYQLRFNNNFEYNSSHGTNRSSFTRNMKNNLIRFMERLHDREITFTNLDFREINYLEYTKNDFFYFDPPYYITSSPYHDGRRGYGDWTLNEEEDLYELLDNLDTMGYRWGLSNSLIHNGEHNLVLREWLNTNTDYNLYVIESDYTNSSYQKKNRDNSKNMEVYITNINTQKIKGLQQ